MVKGLPPGSAYGVCRFFVCDGKVVQDRLDGAHHVGKSDEDVSQKNAEGGKHGLNAQGFQELSQDADGSPEQQK